MQASQIIENSPVESELAEDEILAWFFTTVW